MLVTLAGCSTLPTINPDLAMPKSSVQLSTAKGPLSFQQSREILAKLASKAGQETSIFDRHLALEETVADSPLLIGNKATLLRDGPATYQAMFAAIRSARDFVLLETYIIEDDEIGRQFADALIAKRAQGVEVALLYDSVGAFSTPREFFTRLSDAGVKVVEFNPVNPLTAKAGWQVNQRDHRKVLVVDNRVAFVGGINISSVYSSGSRPGSGGNRSKSSRNELVASVEPGGAGAATVAPAQRNDAGPGTPWRDTHLQLEGPVVAEFRKMFIDAWNAQKGKPLAMRNATAAPKTAGPDIVRAIGSSPDEPYSQIYATLISAINSAESTVWLTNAYFVPDPQLLGALVAAAKRGVDVKIVLPSKSDFWLVLHAGRSFYEELLAGGVKIYERRDALLHAKTAVIDGVWSTIGSTNLDWRSFLHNHEINAVILGADFGAEMQRMFQADLAASDPITLEQWQRRPLSNRMAEMTGRLWSRWL